MILYKIANQYPPGNGSFARKWGFGWRGGPDVLGPCLPLKELKSGDVGPPETSGVSIRDSKIFPSDLVKVLHSITWWNDDIFMCIFNFQKEIFQTKPPHSSWAGLFKEPIFLLEKKTVAGMVVSPSGSNTREPPPRSFGAVRASVWHHPIRFWMNCAWSWSRYISGNCVCRWWRLTLLLILRLLWIWMFCKMLRN